MTFIQEDTEVKQNETEVTGRRKSKRKRGRNTRS